MRTFIILLLVFTGISCSPVRVVSTETFAEDLSRYKTYNYYQPTTSPGVYDDVLLAAIDKQLEERGFTKSDNPDLKINIGKSFTNVAQTRETDYRDIRYSGERNYQWESDEVIVNEYKEGTVVLDIVETSSGNLVWQGIAASILEGELNKKNTKMAARIDAAIEKLFRRFPG